MERSFRTEEIRTDGEHGVLLWTLHIWTVSTPDDSLDFDIAELWRMDGMPVWGDAYVRSDAFCIPHELQNAAGVAMKVWCIQQGEYPPEAVYEKLEALYKILAPAYREEIQ